MVSFIIFSGSLSFVKSAITMKAYKEENTFYSLLSKVASFFFIKIVWIYFKLLTFSLVGLASSHFWAIFFKFSSLRPVMATLAPFLAKCTAVPAPIPELAP